MHCEALLTGQLKMAVVPVANDKVKHIRPRQHRNKGLHDNEASMDGSIGIKKNKDNISIEQPH